MSFYIIVVGYYCLYFQNTLGSINGSYQWFNKQREGGRCDACNPIAYQQQTNISPFRLFVSLGQIEQQVLPIIQFYDIFCFIK